MSEECLPEVDSVPAIEVMAYGHTEDIDFTIRTVVPANEASDEERLKHYIYLWASGYFFGKTVEIIHVIPRRFNRWMIDVVSTRKREF